MNILLADSHRDLLQSYERLLTMKGHQVTTAFDGTQVMQLTAERRFDLVILEEHLPRISGDSLLEMLRDAHVPVIVLLDRRVTANHLLRPTLPSAYLSLPFLPEDLFSLVDDVAQKAHATECRTLGGVPVDEKGFCLAGTDIGLTAAEINLLDALAQGQKVGGKRDRTLIQALNQKLRGLGMAIQYEIEKGYRLMQA